MRHVYTAPGRGREVAARGSDVLGRRRGGAHPRRTRSRPGWFGSGRAGGRATGSATWWPSRPADVRLARTIRDSIVSVADRSARRADAGRDGGPADRAATSEPRSLGTVSASRSSRGDPNRTSSQRGTLGGLRLAARGSRCRGFAARLRAAGCVRPVRGPPLLHPAGRVVAGVGRPGGGRCVVVGDPDQPWAGPRPGRSCSVNQRASSSSADEEAGLHVERPGRDPIALAGGVGQQDGPQSVLAAPGVPPDGVARRCRAPRVGAATSSPSVGSSSPRPTGQAWAFSAIQPRSCRIGAANASTRSTFQPENSATSVGVAPARSRAWMSRAVTGVVRDVHVGAAAAGGRSQPLVDGQPEAGAVAARQDQRGIRRRTAPRMSGSASVPSRSTRCPTSLNAARSAVRQADGAASGDRGRGQQQGGNCAGDHDPVPALAAPWLSIRTPDSGEPTARPTAMPEVAKVSASVSRAAGTRCSTIVTRQDQQRRHRHPGQERGHHEQRQMWSTKGSGSARRPRAPRRPRPSAARPGHDTCASAEQQARQQAADGVQGQDDAGEFLVAEFAG